MIRAGGGRTPGGAGGGAGGKSAAADDGSNELVPLSLQVLTLLLPPPWPHSTISSMPPSHPLISPQPPLPHFHCSAPRCMHRCSGRDGRRATLPVI
jgi:hypothetical protein